MKNIGWAVWLLVAASAPPSLADDAKALSIPGFVATRCDCPNAEEAWMQFTKPSNFTRYALTNSTTKQPVLIAILKYKSSNDARKAFEMSWAGRPQAPQTLEVPHWDAAHIWQTEALHLADLSLFKQNYFVGVYNLSSGVSTNSLINALADSPGHLK